MSEQERSFNGMGTGIRLVGSDAGALDDAAAWLRSFDARLSRFRPDSELCALNADPRHVVPASALLRAAVGAALWAAGETGGLVDPTLLGALRRAGYARSLSGVAPASLRAALDAAPPRRPARAHPTAAWREVQVDDAAGAIARPPGLTLDTGGTSKGLAADAVSHLLGTAGRHAVDCGGDLRVGGAGAEREPFEVEVAHPFGGPPVHRLWMRSGAVATSGIDARLWRTPGGGFAHHLLDPETGAPAWTGLVTVTALGPTALEAETLAKTALLSGPAAAPELLARHGGVLVHDDGYAELAGPLARAGRTAA
ncbi:MAG: FAD:protein FMN transferase [Solirubrobacteraceae bacterium]